MNRATAMARPVRALSSLLSRRPCFRPPETPSSRLLHSSLQNSTFTVLNLLQKSLPFSSSVASDSRDVRLEDFGRETENLVCSKLCRESVIYGLKKLDKAPKKALDLFRWVEEKDQVLLGHTAYVLMLRILARKEWMSEFWVLLREMKEKGHEFDRETYETLAGSFAEAEMVVEVVALREFYDGVAKERESDDKLSAVVEVVLGSDWSDEVGKKLEEIGIALSDKMVLRILRQIRVDPVKALGFFRWTSGRLDYKHSSTTYNAMLRIVGTKDSIDQFWGLVEEMKSEGFDIDIDTYVKLLRQFQKRKLMKEAVELYEMMMEGPYKPSIQDCSTLLRQLSTCETEDSDLVFRLTKIYEASGYSLSKSIYDGIHRVLTCTGRFGEAEKIVQTMKDAGFEPDNITYSQLVFGLCKFGRLEEACKLLDDMETWGCSPDLKTWTILIRGHCILGETDKALSCYAKMIEKGCDADADLLEVLVQGLLTKNKVDGAYTLVSEIVAMAKIRPWQATYKLLIERLLGERKLEEALKVLGLMKKHNYPPYADAFTRYLSKFGTVHDATEYFNTLKVKRYPSSSSYGHVFEGFFKEGRYSEAQDLLYKCPHHIRNHADILNLFGGTKVKKALATKKEDAAIVA